MQTGNWIEMGPLNQITYRIRMADGVIRSGTLRFTVSQAERYSALAEQEAPGTLAEQRTALALLALNPDHEKPEWTPEDLAGALDLDEMGLLVRVWTSRKVSAPDLSRSKDPNFF